MKPAELELAPLGRETGLPLPVDAAAFGGDPAAFLTRAFRAYGSICADEAVARVDRIEAFAGGNSGTKALIDVTYAQPDRGHPTRLFAKFSRDLADPFRDRRRHELDGEVRLAALSRQPAFPVAVAEPMFADFDPASGTGLLITERIAFGEGATEPLHPKCRDHLIADPREHYRVLVSAQARLAAADHSGKLAPEIDRLFPYDRTAAEADLPIVFDAAGLRETVSAWRAFIADHPQLFPPGLRDRSFTERLEHDACAFLRHEAAVRRFLQSDPRMIALCHWNANIDNAWFWRGEDGGLRCGLLDWGMVRRMNVATGLWGGLSAAGTGFLLTELNGLLDHYCNERAAAGGLLPDRQALDLHFDMSLALTGLALMMDLPALVAARMPDIGRAEGPLDPLIGRDMVVEGFLLVSTNFLALWNARPFGESLKRIT